MTIFRSATAPLKTPASTPRLLSLDVYRGLIMLTLAGGGFGIAEAAASHDGRVWRLLHFQFEHTAWISHVYGFGCAYWDLIQPTFMFMVGVSMPYSYARRRERGDSSRRMFWHLVVRAVVLVLLGVLPYFLAFVTSYEFNWLLKGWVAMVLVVSATAWTHLGYNIAFYVAGLLAIPGSVLEAADVDGAGPIRRFTSIVVPLVSPITFYLVVLNMVFAFFESFGVIDAVTKGGPGHATEIMVYKLYKDGFIGLNLGSSGAQSVILMIVVFVLTIFQFRFIERRVHYN